MARYLPPHTPNGFYQGSGRPVLPTAPWGRAVFDVPVERLPETRVDPGSNCHRDIVKNSSTDHTLKTKSTVLLRELRKKQRVSQQEMAQRLSIQQAAVSKLERRDDMHLSTLRKYVQALGGRLEIVVHFSESLERVRGEGGVHLTLRGEKTPQPKISGDCSGIEAIPGVGLPH